MLARQNRVEAGLVRALRQQSFNPALFIRIIKWIGPTQMLATHVIRDRDRKVMRGEEVDLFAV